MNNTKSTTTAIITTTATIKKMSHQQQYNNPATGTTTGHQLPTSTVGRELSIASTFVKQYYTLLNKAPCYIHNFYSQDSTFIHGTVEMGQDNYTEPVIGREEIKRKMEDLKLHDCRAKIQQIDCLETLAGGLVIQVIGDLSNNGKPMRRFLQTFVLAPSPEDPSVRQEHGDSHASSTTAPSTMNNASKTGNPSTNTPVTTGPATSTSADNQQADVVPSRSSSHNQKFFVLNSIFRYQDDGPDNEFEDGLAGIQTNMSTENPISGRGEQSSKIDLLAKPNQRINGPPLSKQHDGSQILRKRPIDTTSATNQNEIDVDRSITNTFDESTKLGSKQQAGGDCEDVKRSVAPDGPSLSSVSVVPSSGISSNNNANSVVVLNGTSGSTEKKNETSDKSTENGKMNVDHSQAASNITNSNSGIQAAATHIAQPTTAARPQPTNEPKTWANAVRNAHSSATSAQGNISKPTSAAEPQAQLQQNLTQLSQASSQQQQHLQTNQSQRHIQQSQAQQQQKDQSAMNNGGNSLNNNGSNNNNNNPNRRRNAPRKLSSNKPAGRSIKNRPRPTTTTTTPNAVPSTTASASITATTAPTSAPTVINTSSKPAV